MNNRIRSFNVQLGESLTLSNKADFVSEGGQEHPHKQAIDEMLIKAREEAKVIVEQAERKAAEIMEKIEGLKQQSIQKGFEEGFKQGREEGIIQAKKECYENFWGLYTLTSAAFQVKKEIIDSAEKEILELATSIAEKVIRNQLELKPELMQNIIKAAIDQLQDKEEIKIIVNPVLTQNLYDFAEELREKTRGIKIIKLTEDKTIPKDGVIVESPDSRIDGRVETQLREIIRNLMLEFSKKSNSAEKLPEEIEAKIDQKASEQ